MKVHEVRETDKQILISKNNEQALAPFYFKSEQIIIPLSNSYYRWINQSLNKYARN